MGQFHIHALDDGLRGDVVFLVVGDLLGAAAISFADGLVHGISAAVGIENGAALDVPGAAANGLDQRRGTAEKTFLVRVEYGDKRNFGKVEAFSQKIDADKDVEFTSAQITKNLDAVKGFHFGVEIAATHADFGKIFA